MNKNIFLVSSPSQKKNCLTSFKIELPADFSAQFGITQLMDPQFLQDQSEAGPLAALRFVGRLGPPLGPLGSLGKLGQ